MDPIRALLNLTLRGFLKADLKKDESAFVQDNIRKHRIVLWINLGACVLVYLGLRSTPTNAIGTVITSLLAPVMVLGGAWFAISFGGVPRKLLGIAMSITLWMFMAFLMSLSAMLISVAFVTSFWFWPVLALIYVGTVVACILYDTTDGLKAGLDEAMLKHSRAALMFYEKQGIDPDEGPQGDGSSDRK
jgi:hypothetical protein